jgi:steroid Delta-isomerase
MKVRPGLGESHPSEMVAAEHVRLFNEAVSSGWWEPFIDTFATDAELEFIGVPAGPFVGRPAIAQAYRANPPDDTIAIDGAARREGDAIAVPYRWNRTNEKGTMRLTHKHGLITKLVVTFG